MKDSASLKIFGWKTSSNVIKVLWCCEEVGIPFDRIDVGGQFGYGRFSDYGSLNPNK